MSLRFLFLVTVLLGSVAVPLTGEPRGAKKVWRIGVLWHAGGPEEEAPFLGAFRVP